MKVLLALAVLATSATSFASERALYDIMYLPTAGTTYGFSEAEYLDIAIGGRSGAGDIDASGYGLTQTIGHSFTDRLSVEAAIGYGDVRLDNEDARNTNQSGLSDPTLNARFRVMDEAFRFDVLAGALFSIQDSEIDSDGDADNLQGGHAVNLGAQFGAKNEYFQWAVLGNFTYNMDREVEIANSNEDLDSSNDFLLRGDILNKLTEKGYMRSFVSANFNDIVESDDAGTFEPSSTKYTIGTEYQHLCTENFLARAGVDYGKVEQDSGFESSNSQWTVRLAANYQF